MSFGTRYTTGVAVLAGIAMASAAVLSARAPGQATFETDLGSLIGGRSRPQTRAKKPRDRKGLRKRTNRDHAKQRAKLRR